MPDPDLGPLQGNSARESPGRGPAWGRDGSRPQQCESVIAQSPIIKPGYFPCRVNDPTPHIHWRVAECGLQGSVRQCATEVLCSSYGAGPSLSPGVFRTTRGHVIPRAGVRAVVAVALISGPFGLSLNSDLNVEELFHVVHGYT